MSFKRYNQRIDGDIAQGEEKQVQLFRQTSYARLDQRYFTTASFLNFSAAYAISLSALNAAIASGGGGGGALPSDYYTFTASVKTFSASIYAYTASMNTFSAAVNAYTASLTNAVLVSKVTQSLDLRYSPALSGQARAIPFFGTNGTTIESAAELTWNNSAKNLSLTGSHDIYSFPDLPSTVGAQTTPWRISFYDQATDKLEIVARRQALGTSPGTADYFLHRTQGALTGGYIGFYGAQGSTTGSGIGLGVNAPLSGFPQVYVAPSTFVGINTIIPRAPLDVSGAVYPNKNNLFPLGTGSYTWNNVWSSYYTVYGAAGTRSLQMTFQTSDISFYEIALFGQRSFSLNRAVWAFELFGASSSGTLGNTKSTAFSIYEQSTSRNFNEQPSGTNKFYSFAVNGDTAKGTSSDTFCFSVRAMGTNPTGMVNGSYFAAFAWTSVTPATPVNGFGYRHYWKAAYVNTDMLYSSLADQAYEESYWQEVSNRKGGWRVLPSNTGIGLAGFACHYTSGGVLAAAIGGTPSSTANSLHINLPTGIGTNAPLNTLDITGALVVGSGYAGTLNASKDGATIQGRVCIGHNRPIDFLNVSGALTLTSTSSLPAATMHMPRLYASSSDGMLYFQNTTGSFPVATRTILTQQVISSSVVQPGAAVLRNPNSIEIPIVFSGSLAGIGLKVYSNSITAGSVGIAVQTNSQNPTTGAGVQLGLTPYVSLSTAAAYFTTAAYAPGTYPIVPGGNAVVFISASTDYAQGTAGLKGIQLTVYAYT